VSNIVQLAARCLWKEGRNDFT